MKLEQCLKQVVEREAETLQTEKKRAKGNENKEWRAIVVAFSYPELGPKQMWRNLSAEETKGYSYEELYRDMDTVNLNDKEKRNQMLSYVKETADILLRALAGDQVAAMEFSQLTEDFDERDQKIGKPFFKAKYLIVYLSCLDDRFKGLIPKDLARYYGNKYCKRIFWNLRNGINKALDVKYDRKSTNFLQKARKDIEKKESKLNTLSQEEKMVQLEFMVDSYRNALELAENRFEEMQDVLEAAASDAKTKAVMEFYMQMNSPKYGNLLDGLLVVEHNIQQAKKEKVKIPRAYVPLSIFIRQMHRFVKESGVHPIHEVGVKKKVTLKDVSGMNYQGSTFETEDEVKTVVFVTPGWEYDGHQIAVPSIKEV